ncbi:hypothetical protein BKA80DRAFT_271676 [Phyllosticta citrichinensis]
MAWHGMGIYSLLFPFFPSFTASPIHSLPLSTSTPTFLTSPTFFLLSHSHPPSLPPTCVRTYMPAHQPTSPPTIHFPHFPCAKGNKPMHTCM